MALRVVSRLKALPPPPSLTLSSIPPRPSACAGRGPRSPIIFFRKFQFAASSAVSSIDSLLAALPASAGPPAPGGGPAAAAGASDGGPVSASDVAQIEATLDALLGTADLLSEIKTGANPRLTDFLARAECIERLGGWIVWGLGGEQEEAVPNGGIIADDVADGKVPDIVVAPAEKKKAGMGRVPRRRDMDQNGELEGGEPETEQEKGWSTFPRLATEILASDSPSLAAILYEPATLSSQPHTCPSPTAFLEPFWESLLRSTELQLETRAVQVGYWARVNGVLLSGPHGAEVLGQLSSMPHLLPRLLTLLPSCSPINDLLLLIMRISSPPSPLLSSLVPSTLRMLDPYNSLGKQGHVAAEELLRGVIELCSAAPTPNPPGAGAAPSAGQHSQDGPEWRENGLARQLADDRAVKMMVNWMLAGVDVPLLNDDLPNSPPPPDEVTPRVGTRRLPSLPGGIDDLRTSSLIQSISVLVDLIRKNNSDFVEQQMLAWARRKEQEDAERTRLEADGSKVVSEAALGDATADRGPSLVDLGALLATVAERLSGFQLLIKTPRSPHGPTLTSAGSITPLTLERFRICEFYAELLHCSNMSLLNRPPRYDSLYDADGYLADGWRAANELAEAVAGATPDEAEPELERDLPMLPTPTSSSPIDVGVGPYSGLSTPSGQGSLDSESGILTRAEAKELRDLVAASDAPADDSEEDDPFGDPSEPMSDADLAEATEAIDLDSNIHPHEQDVTAEPPGPVPPVPRLTTLQSSIEAVTLPPGPLLKHKFLEHRVIETMLDLFFAFPWNNFLHNVVFDILQQIFHGRIDRDLDRQLALSVFLDGRLINRILDGQELNDSGVRARKLRLGYMGHMTLVAEEIVKLFEHYPAEIHAVVEPHIPQPAWDRYVATTLRETRERDLSPLGGGISIGPHDTSSSTSQSLSDEDDEFPMNHNRVLKAMEAGSSLDGGTARDEGAFGGHAPVSSSGDEGDPSENDRFSRYLANAMSSDRPDKFSSDEEEDEDGGWLGGSRFDPGDVDFALANAPKSFGFEDQFGSATAEAFRSSSPDSDDDADWGPFATDGSASAAAPDGFRPTVEFASNTSGFESSFSDAPFDNFAPVLAGADASAEDDFGDFEGAAGPSVVLPAMGDFDFAEDARSSDAGSSSSPTAHAPRLPRPVFARTATADDGSALFGGFASPESPGSSPFGRHRSLSPPQSPSIQADLATSAEEPLGPGMQPGSHLTEEGFVETTIDGKLIRVPADEIALAHRRSSIDSEPRPTLEELVVAA